MLVNADLEPGFRSVFYTAHIHFWSELLWELFINPLEEYRPSKEEVINRKYINRKFFFRFHVSNGDFLEIVTITLFHVFLNIDDKITNTFYKLMPRLAQSGFFILVVIREFNPGVARSVELRAEHLVVESFPYGNMGNVAVFVGNSIIIHDLLYPHYHHAQNSACSPSSQSSSIAESLSFANSRSSK